MQHERFRLTEQAKEDVRKRARSADAGERGVPTELEIREPTTPSLWWLWRLCGGVGRSTEKSGVTWAAYGTDTTLCDARHVRETNEWQRTEQTSATTRAEKEGGGRADRGDGPGTHEG
jgi:hypothetical protein